MKYFHILFSIFLISACSTSEEKGSAIKNNKSGTDTVANIKQLDYSTFTVDTLKFLLTQAKNDTNKVDILLAIVNNAKPEKQESDQLMKFANEALKISNALRYKSGMANGLTAIGNQYFAKQEYQNALINYLNALNLWEELDNKISISSTLAKIGQCYIFTNSDEIGMSYIQKGLDVISKSIDTTALLNYYKKTGGILSSAKKYNQSNKFFTSAISLLEERKDEKSQSTIYWFIAMNYSQESNYEKAIQNLLQSLKLAENSNYSEMVSSNYWFLSNYYLQLKNYEQSEIFLTKLADLKESNGESTIELLQVFGALYLAQGNKEIANEYFNKYLEETKLGGNAFMIALSYYNMGLTCQRYDKQKAIFYFQIALEKAKNLEVNGLGFQNMIRTNLRSLYIEHKDYNKVIQYSKMIVMYYEEIEKKESLKSEYKLLADSYSKVHDFDNAYKYSELYHSIKDSLTNENRNKSIIEIQKQNEFEKQLKSIDLENQKSKLLQESKQEISNIELKNQKNISIIAGIGLVFIIILAGLIFYRYQLTNKQKNIIETQKIIVEEKQKEILDSIHYAKRIQQSLMPNEKYIDKSIKRLNKK